ncbi:MAG: DMT family transporter [Eubacteriales bacterium]|nr:DMT family transporter [Eubacteriales bacterium]
MKNKERFWTALPTVILMTFICCFLWGSAFPCIKTGYRLLRIGAEDTAEQLLFAGCRFTLAGILVILFTCIEHRRLIYPRRKALPYVGLLAFLQTCGQYFFFYIGLAHCTGVSSAIIQGANTFFCILIAALLFRTEKLTGGKILGCLIGFAGVVLIQLPSTGSGSLQLAASWNGEGFMLIACLLGAMASSAIKWAGKKEDTTMLCGYQFLLGGLVLVLIGLISGGRLVFGSAACFVLLLYMAFISAVAYTLWSVLLKYNPVSRISVFGFMNPVIGVLLSAVILGEANQAFSVRGLLALVFVSAGIIVVNRQK